MNRVLKFLSLRSVCGLILLFAFGAWPTRCQEAASSPAKQAAKTPEASDKQQELPAQIELLETRVRFEASGDSRKEVHTRVHINNELGARQFARLTFNYNRSFQQIEFPLVRITHTGGGTVDILPSAVADQPNPAVVNAPAYQDVRSKSVRLLGLTPSDLLEYSVITTTSNHPLAPNFYIAHDFAKNGVAAKEVFEIDLPASRDVKPLASSNYQDYERVQSGDGNEARYTYRWNRAFTPGEKLSPPMDIGTLSSESDVALTSYRSWADFQVALQTVLSKPLQVTAKLTAKSRSLTSNATKPEEKLRAQYDFVAKALDTIDVPLELTGFSSRPAESILGSGYATSEEKCVLLTALASAAGMKATPAFSLLGKAPSIAPPIPSLLRQSFVLIRISDRTIWLDPSAEVSPFGMIAAALRGKPVVPLNTPTDIDSLEEIPKDLPFAASQRVSVRASLTAEGGLYTKVRYLMRGDNELLLRVAFHQAPREKWKDIAQLLALSDGFRGQIVSVSASDPYATKEPFAVEYEISQPKFVDWAKKPVRIPALLPQLGLPDQGAKPATGAATSAIDLGTPLDVETQLTLRLPAGTSVRTPTGTSVERDYATFASKYAVSGSTVTATRHLNFLLRAVRGDRAADYNAFVRAVQGDEAQEFTLERGEVASQETKPENSAKKN